MCTSYLNLIRKVKEIVSQIIFIRAFNGINKIYIIEKILSYAFFCIIFWFGVLGFRLIVNVSSN